ncbi:MAG: biotin synthase BioB [Gammaproteobacteria bacterium]|jgi:biotin synthase
MSSNAKVENLFPSLLRHDWGIEEVNSLFSLPFNDLVYKAQTIHRKFFNPNEIQLSTLVNIKSGGCPEDCAYCPQSIRYKTSADVTPLMALSDVIDLATKAKENGASRFCMGAAWRSPKEKDIKKINQMIVAVKKLGLETCATLGMLTDEQAESLKAAGLDYYNHNLDTSPDFYKKIISTRVYKDRLNTLASVRKAELKVCCGGIIGMGETNNDRGGLLLTLANMKPHPESVPINMLVKVSGTPLNKVEATDSFDMVRTISVARILMPRAYVRLSAGRSEMSDEAQALCFMVGANSIFFGDKLLTTENPDRDHDLDLFSRLGISQSAQAN